MPDNKKIQSIIKLILLWMLIALLIDSIVIWAAESDKTKTIGDIKPPFTMSIITLTPDGKPQPGVKIKCVHPRSQRGTAIVDMVATSNEKGVAEFNITKADLVLDRYFWFSMADENFVGNPGVGISPIDNEYTYTFKVLPAEKYQILILDENDKPIPDAKLWLYADHPEFPRLVPDMFRAIASATTNSQGLADVTYAKIETNIVKYPINVSYDNAIKYNRDGGSVTINCQQTDASHGRITVTDTGHGIATEDQTTIFEPFSRLYLNTYAAQGTGIGLAITKQLIELMGGSIGIESQPGIGSAFWVELDLADETESECEAETPDDQDARRETNKGQQHTLLYVEDSPSHIQLLEAIVRKMPDIRLLTAHTPKLGLELAQTHKPDMIILDICLPGMDGYEVLGKLQEHETLRYTPVIAISANAMPRS